MHAGPPAFGKNFGKDGLQRQKWRQSSWFV